ncbi:MAG: ATP phosphoribosyltransferase [Acidobacteriota bacterium]|nr:ATP phosphoribosyltransferase [Acidobacteriota bacterium]
MADRVNQKLKLLIPKGKIFPAVANLLLEAGLFLEVDDRAYYPRTGDPQIEAKLMKPQNIAQLVEIGSHDAGFTGYDWIVETGSRVEEILDTGFDPVEIVSAAQTAITKQQLRTRRLIVASEYENISRKYLEKETFDYVFIRTYGATEAFPPQDADLIIDNTSTGKTLKENGLKIIDRILSSSTRFIANPVSLQDTWKKEKIGELNMLFESVLNARERVMLEMNLPKDKLEEIVPVLPCMRAPTVSLLYDEKGYAVKVAVRKKEATKLIPLLKKMGATDILEYEIKKVII